VNQLICLRKRIATTRARAEFPLSAHKTKRVEEFLAEHPNVHMHFTPTYSSWLNRVELWFAKIERDVIARGVFTSVNDLRRKLMRYIRQYNKAPRTVKWESRARRNRVRGTSHTGTGGRHIAE
jgi:transposase